MRSAHNFRYTVPTLDDCRSHLERVIAGEESREECASWALEYIIYDNPQIYPEVSDSRVQRALTTLVGIDAKVGSGPGEYLYGEHDFPAWLIEMESR